MLVNKQYEINLGNTVLEYNNIGGNTSYSMYGDEFPVAPQAGIKPFVQPTSSENGFQFGTGDYPYMASQFEPNNALKDDNSIILWQSGYPAYLYIGYKYPMNITKLTIRNMDGRMPYHYEVYVSEDFDHWTKIKEGTNTDNVSFSTWDIELSDTNYHKFYKLNILDNQRDSTGSVYYTDYEMGFEYMQITATYKETTFTPMEGNWVEPINTSSIQNGLMIESTASNYNYPPYNLTNPNQDVERNNAVMDGASFPYYLTITNNHKLRIKQVLVGNQGWKGYNLFAGRVTKDWVFEYKNDEGQWIALTSGTNSNFDSYCESDGTVRPDGFFVITVPNPVAAQSYRIKVLNTTKSFVNGTYHTSDSVVFSYIKFIADEVEYPEITGTFTQPVFTSDLEGFNTTECSKDGLTITADSNLDTRGVGYLSDNTTILSPDVMNVWHSYSGYPHYINFNYISPLKLKGIKIWNGAGNVIPNKYTVQYKSGDNYIDLLSSANALTQQGDYWFIDLTFNTTASTDWRLVFTSGVGDNGDYYVGILETQLIADVME